VAVHSHASLAGRFAFAVLLSLLTGLIFLGAAGSDDRDPSSFITHVGAVTVVAVQAMFACGTQALIDFPEQRPLFVRVIHASCIHV
jgi:hypothetical protein